MPKLRNIGTPQKFVSIHASALNLFNQECRRFDVFRHDRATVPSTGER